MRYNIYMSNNLNQKIIERWFELGSDISKRKQFMKFVSFEEAKEITAKVVEVSQVKTATKLPIDNVVFDRLGEVPLLEMLVNLNVVTKEHVNGTNYDKKNFQMVMRIIGGKLLMRGQDMIDRPDAYAWKIDKVIKAKNKKALGFHSVEGAQTYAQLIGTIKEQYEKDLFTDLLVNWSKDLMLIHTESEDRTVIEVTDKLISECGISEVPNSYDIEWPAEGATGVELTPIKVGDALIIEQCSFGTAFYVIQKDEYELTHVTA